MFYLNRIIFLFSLSCIVFLFTGCSDSYSDKNDSGPSNGDYGYSNPYSTESEANEDDPANYFYFSYDDSASTAAVELAKFYIYNGELIPESLSRPWEFLNYETFTPESTEEIGIFEYSMGLWERPSIDNDNINEYRLGVYFASPVITRAERKNAVITFIIDISGSMDSWVLESESVLSRLELVKYALGNLKESLKEGDIINIVTFSDDAKTVLSAAPYSSYDSKILPEIRNLNTEGSTNLNAGIELGYEEAIKSYDKNKMNRVVLLTDAYANTGEIDPENISQHTELNNMEGIYFSGIGVGMDYNESFLDILTEAGKGAYFTMYTKTDADRAFNERFISLLSVAARDVKFKLEFPEEMTHISTASEESSQDESEVSSTNFSYNTKQYFYEVFNADSEVDSSSTFTLTVTYKDPESLETNTETITKKMSEILGDDENCIRDAEMIYTLNKMIDKTTTYDHFQNIIQKYYTEYTSDIFEEYNELIEKMNESINTGE